MPEEDPVIQAVQQVDAPGEGATDHAEEIGALEEPDESAVPVGTDESADEQSRGFDVRTWAKRVPEGSHRDWDPSDLWDVEEGGEARIAFHVSDAVGADGTGLPNGLGVLIGFMEFYVRLAQGHVGLGSDGDDSGAPDGELYE